MDRILRPERFDVEPSTPQSERCYKHCKLMFENYLRVTGNDSEIGNTSKNFFTQINTISTAVYNVISDTNDYYSAIKALDAAYIKPENFIYNRHQLLTLRQQPAQTIDAFIIQLEVLAKSCNFQAVTAEENKNQYIRDTFISSITSSFISQCLLNKSSLTLQET